MQLLELDELKNHLDSLNIYKNEYLTENEILDLQEFVFELIDEYLLEFPKDISEPDFHINFKEDIEDLVHNYLKELLFMNENLLDLVDEILENIIEIYFICLYPIRSFSESVILNPPNIFKNEKQINILRNEIQPEQRTNEWYIFRHNLITASNAYKAFENQTIQNSLIYEKCQPLLDLSSQTTSTNHVNVDLPLHWGQKYERISVLIYENDYKTKVEDFGCIKHSQYSFLGASPDGINVDKTSERFGRMLEIKNVVNREINGIPKKEYWIQMQLQMEVCNLDECDFLETKFIEYESYSQFKLDYNSKKGIIMYFSNKDGNPVYFYKPLNIDSDEKIEEWENSILKSCETNLTWIKNIYWKLEHLSCVLVLRNKNWFNQNINDLQLIWNIILKERVDGYEHRKPNKKIKKETVYLDNINGCLLTIDKDTKKILLNI